jgi:outer membrane protein
LLPWLLTPAFGWSQPSQPGPPPGVSIPAPGAHLSLDEALAIAARDHPTLQTAAEQTQADVAAQGIEASALRPHVGLEGVWKDGPNSAPGLGFQGLANSSIISNFGGQAGDLVFSQVLADFGRAESRVASRRYTTEADVQSYLAQRQWVAWGVAQAYDAALGAQKLEEVAKEDVDSRALVVRQAQARFDAGLVSRVDVDFARANLAAAQVRLTNAIANVQEAFASLNTAMGVVRPGSYQLDDVSTTPALPATPVEQDVLTALRQRPELSSYDEQMRALGEQAKAYAADARPLLRTEITAGAVDAQKSAINQPHNYAGALIFTWPFMNGGLTRSEIQQVQHLMAALAGRRETLAQQIRLQVTQDRANLAALIQSRPASIEQLHRAQDVVKLATERYRTGLGSLIEVQEAQAALLEAETNVTQLNYQIATAQAALQYALGAYGGR